MIKVKRNRLKIFEEVAPEMIKKDNLEVKLSLDLLKDRSKSNANLHSCVLDESLFEEGTNSLTLILPYQLTEENLYTICRFYGDISYFKINSDSKKISR